MEIQRIFYLWERSNYDLLSLLTQNEEKKLYSECDILLQAKKILTDYYSDYQANSNASKIDRYVTEIDVDMNNPFFMLKDNLQLSTQMLDLIFIIKKSQLLHLN